MTALDTLKYWAKAGVQLLGAVMTAVLPILSTGVTGLTPPEWVNVALIAVGAAVVWNTTNHPEWPYGKVIGSGLITALTVLNSFIAAGPITSEAIIQIILSLSTTLVVGAVPNVVPQTDIPMSQMNPEN